MRVFCFGDSNTYGYDPRSYLGGRYPEHLRWVNILGDLTGWDMINCGENGREIPRRDLEVRRFLTELEQADADLLIILLGGNDHLQGASPQETANRMNRFLDAIQKSSGFSGRILLIGPPPKKLGAWVPTQSLVNASKTLSDLYQQVAENRNVGFLDTRNWGIELCFDGVHFTESGHRALAEGIFREFPEGSD